MKPSFWAFYSALWVLTAAGPWREETYAHDWWNALFWAIAAFCALKAICTTLTSPDGNSPC